MPPIQQAVLDTGLVIGLGGDRIDGYSVTITDGGEASEIMRTHDAGAALFAYKAIRTVLEFLMREAELDEIVAA